MKSVTTWLLFYALLPQVVQTRNYSITQNPSMTATVLHPQEMEFFIFTVCDPTPNRSLVQIQLTITLDGQHNQYTFPPVGAALPSSEENKATGYAHAKWNWTTSSGSHCAEFVTRVWNTYPTTMPQFRSITLGLNIRPPGPETMETFDIVLSESTVSPSTACSFMAASTSSQPYPTSTLALYAFAAAITGALC